MSGRFPRVHALIREAEAAAAEQGDPVAALVAVIRLVIQSDADPYLLSGAMIEGIAATISARIPAERRAEVSAMTLKLLRDRLGAYGTF